MLLRTVVRDCLYLNWALPRSCLPDPPAGLRYELHGSRAEPVVLLSALLFRQAGLRWRGVPPVGLSHPQMNLRTYVTDADGLPAVLFHALLVPGWAGVLARATLRVPCTGARFDYPARIGRSGDGGWRWRVRREGRALDVAARPGNGRACGEPRLGGWNDLTESVRRRDRGYVATPKGVRRIDTEHERVAVLPVSIDLRDIDLLTSELGTAGTWPALHSAWLCPHMALDLAVARPRETVVQRRVPAPG